MTFFQVVLLVCAMLKGYCTVLLYSARGILFSVLLLYKAKPDVARVVSCSTCLQPAVTSSYYSSMNKKLSQSTAFIVEFTLKCKNNPQNLLLFADVNGMQFPVTKSPEGNNYQVSWTTESTMQSGNFYIRFFDEEGYSNLRKALRSSHDASEIKELFSVPLQHLGMSTPLGLQSEFLALSFASIAFYVVCKERSDIIA